MKDKNLMHKMLTDQDGKESSKRIVTFISFIMLAIAFFANLFGNYEVDDFMFEGIQWIVVAGLFAGAVEKFGRRSSGSSDNATGGYKQSPPGQEVHEIG